MTTYENLLLDYVPRPIRSKRAHDKALRQIDDLMSQPQLGKAESEMVELLATLIERYEEADYPTPAATPAELVEHLLEVRGLTQAQAARATGIPRATFTNLLAGRRRLSKANALKLADFFGVAARLFLEE